ncbi:hypothetical protein OA101_04425, partial [Alphaproteobacteria bacterium]|nr:hypothetical protein [Alphaproteobacteria bacterium]
MEGNDGDDVINAGAGADYIRSGDGDDTIDGGAGGTDEWNRDDVVSFDGNREDYELTSSVVDGQTVVTVSDTRSDGTGTDTLINVERIDFDDTSVNIGVSRYDGYDGNVMTSSSFDGSLFGDVIVGTSGRDYIYGNDGDDELSGLDGPDTFFGGLGDDVIDGGLNGFDEFGTAGQDRVVYDQAMSAYTITYFDAAGGSIEASEYDGAGYIVVSDNATDAFSDGEDTLTNIEVIQFRDQEVSFELSVTQIDSDGDGVADIAAISGTSGADTIEGTGINELITGYNGDDRILGAGGDDVFIDGAGADIYVGGQGEDAL